jgi:hypothetical protein
MLPSAGLGLLALLRRIRSFGGNTLRSFILRCLLLWPHVLRSLRHIWSLFSRRAGSPKDGPEKNGGQAFPRVSGVCEGYSAIYASHDFNSAGGSHLQLGPNNAEVPRLSPIVTVGQPQSAPPSPLLSPGSSHHSGGHSPVDGSSIIGNADDIQLPHIRHINVPLTSTNSRDASTRFAGAPRRPRSPSPVPHSHPLPQSSTLENSAASPSPVRSRPSSLFRLPLSSRPPSPVLFPQPHRSPRSNVPDSPASTQIPNVVISPPSRMQTAEWGFQGIMNAPLSPLYLEEGHSPKFPTADVEHSTPDPLDTGSSVQGNGRQSGERSRPNSLAPSPKQAPHSLPLVYKSQVTLVGIPGIDASGNWSDRKTRTIRPMHAEQVSRYEKKSDM